LISTWDDVLNPGEVLNKASLGFILLKRVTSSMATVIVVGASGFVGSNLVCDLRKEHKVVALFRKQIMRFRGVTHYTYNFEDKDYLKRMMQIVRPDVVIYAAGLHDFMDCHKRPQMADAVNALGPMAISAAAESIPIRFIYLSTAYVFDGKKGSYNENDVVLAETTLGKTKLSGENYVRSKCQTYTIIRLSPLYGLGSYAHPSIFDKMRMVLSKGEKFEVPENEYHSYLYIGVLTKAIDWIIKNETVNDTYHLSGLTKLTSHQFAQELARKLNLDPELLVPTRGMFPDATSLDFSMNGSKFIRQSKIDPLVLEQGFDLFKQLLVR